MWISPEAVWMVPLRGRHDKARVVRHHSGMRRCPRIHVDEAAWMVPLRGRHDKAGVVGHHSDSWRITLLVLVV